MGESRNGPERDSAVAKAGAHLGYGITWALSTILFLLAGAKVDDWVGTEAVFTLLGAFIGAAAGFYYMYYHLVIEPRRRNEREREERDE